MRKVAIIFIFAVIIPSGALAWLALRSLHDEQLIMRARQSQLFQTVADSFAKQTINHIQERQREFAAAVEALLATVSVDEAAITFDERIRKDWPLADVGFSLKLDGAVLSPNMLGRTEGRRFRVDNDTFLCSKETIEVFVSTPKGTMPLKLLDDADKTKKGKIPIAAEETDFRKIVGSETDGIVGRFLQNKLHLLIWCRSARDLNTIFGSELNLERLAQGLVPIMNELDESLRDEICVVILDDTGGPVALSDPKFSLPDWRRPAAAAQIGEFLPHWQAAVYPKALVNFEKAAHRSRWAIGLLIACLVAAIGMGSLLLLTDLRRQLILARQKSDFVSNVSHELKTPLTSIRMFSELLAEDRVAEPEKKTYLRIIGAETARLTRLINNILDFARMEKGEKKYRFTECDLAQIVREALENYRPQFESHGFAIQQDIPNDAHLIRGDCDAIAQIILNLLSNAEKYSGDSKEIKIEFDRPNAGEVQIRVLDRGLGVPSDCREKIFEQFFRAHDSLSSGIQGSGLGLTLARQIARAHGGDVVYAPRQGGGSIFTLKLPALP